MKDIANESQFEKRIRDIFNTDILPKNRDLLVLENKKGADIVICRNGSNSTVFIIEVKYYNKAHGRLGFGHEKGAGFQPEILLKRPDFFEKNMRWVLGSIDSENYFFLDNDHVAKYISGGEIDYKQNNIQTKVFDEERGLKRSELSAELLTWLNE